MIKKTFSLFKKLKNYLAINTIFLLNSILRIKVEVKCLNFCNSCALSNSTLTIIDDIIHFLVFVIFLFYPVT